MAATLLAGKPFVRFGAYTAEVADADPQDDFFRLMARDVAPASLPERNDAADIACIFCTSGTTNRPKIVVYDHCAYWLNGLSTLECLGLTRGRPHAGISLVRLELGAGAEPDAVPREPASRCISPGGSRTVISSIGSATTASRSPPACRRC